MADAKTPAKTDKPEAEVNGGTAEFALKLGATALLTAVHGDLIHPFDPKQVFQQGRPEKVTVDNWHQFQHKHGKLAVFEV